VFTNDSWKCCCKQGEADDESVLEQKCLPLNPLTDKAAIMGTGNVDIISVLQALFQQLNLVSTGNSNRSENFSAKLEAFNSLWDKDRASKYQEFTFVPTSGNGLPTFLTKMGLPMVPAAPSLQYRVHKVCHVKPDTPGPNHWMLQKKMWYSPDESAVLARISGCPRRCNPDVPLDPGLQERAKECKQRGYGPDDRGTDETDEDRCPSSHCVSHTLHEPICGEKSIDSEIDHWVFTEVFGLGRCFSDAETTGGGMFNRHCPHSDGVDNVVGNSAKPTSKANCVCNGCS
jgi:hypothetical protein